jgi:hypothetical protein
VSVNAPVVSETTGIGPLRYLDVLLVVVAAPILLLIGVSPVGYGAGAGAWIVLRLVGLGVDRLAMRADARQQISLRLAYLLARVFLLALTVILVRRGAGKDPALTALLVIVVAFTINMVMSFADRPKSLL